MRTKQTIVIIGTGCAGKAIAGRLAGENFHLLLCDKDYSSAEILAKELKNTTLACEVEAMECSFDSAWEADIVILAMHFGEQKEVAGIIKDVVNQKILVSTADTGEELKTEPGTTCCRLEALQQLLPNTRIVRIFSDDLWDQTGNCKSNPAICISGNDNNAVNIISRMLDSVGTNPAAAPAHKIPAE